MERLIVNMVITSGLYRVADTIWRQAEENFSCELCVLSKKSITIICQTNKFCQLVYIKIKKILNNI